LSAFERPFLLERLLSAISFSAPFWSATTVSPEHAHPGPVVSQSVGSRQAGRQAAQEGPAAPHICDRSVWNRACTSITTQTESTAHLQHTAQQHKAHVSTQAQDLKAAHPVHTQFTPCDQPRTFASCPRPC
jgi:hypothetical protein